MKLTSLSALAVGAGLAIAAPVMAFDRAPLLPECPPPDAPVTVTCPDPATPPPQDGQDVTPPPADEAPAVPRRVLRRWFNVEGDVAEVTGGRRRGTITLSGAELDRTPPALADYVDSGDLVVKVTARTRVVTEDGERLDLDEVQQDDAIEVRGKFAPLVQWVEDEDGNVTPLLVAKRVVVIDLGADEQP
ncbi:MAG: hypothetical protein U0237_17385 [Thermoleophilia bacterium]